MKTLLLRFVAGLSSAFILMLSIETSQAASATWKTSPSSRDWNTAANWTPTTVPNGPPDTATFATSSRTSVSLSANTEVNSIVFNSGASPFTITVPVPNYLALTISGAGITNNSGTTQNFVAAGDLSTGYYGLIQFLNNATAGSSTSFTINTAEMYFYNTSSAGSGTFTLNGDPSGEREYSLIAFNNTSSAGSGTFTLNINTLNGGPAGAYSLIDFYDSSSAQNGTFTLNGDPSTDQYTQMDFYGGSTAQNGSFTLNAPAAMYFYDTSSAGSGSFTINGTALSGATGAAVLIVGNADSATLIANAGSNGGDGGTIYFFSNSTGGTSRVEVFGMGTGDFINGNLDISGHNAPGLTIGSIEGNGTVFLGRYNLTVGSNNLNTTFSGVMTDGGEFRGTGGSLTKIGRGKLVLSHRNTYTGGTTVKRGKLIVNNIGHSGTGSGPVLVNAGMLGGKGIIAGAVTVGTGSGQGATLSPGYLHEAGSPGPLTIQSTLTFNADAICKVEVNSDTATADEVIANGVTINTGAQFSFADLGSGTLIPGTVFTVINNTAATPIAGTFSNLPDGGTFTSNGNTYQVSYEGGDGNDLILTVVP